MSNIAEQFIYDKKVWMVGDAPNTIRPTGKYPIIANQQWNTLEDMVNYINDPESSAIPGMILTVVNDGINNGIYFIESVCEVNGDSVKEGVYSKVADNTNINGKIEELFNSYENHLAETVKEHTEIIGKITTAVENHESDVAELQSEIDDSKIYKSKAQENWKTVKVGGVNENTSATEFLGDNEKTISEVLDDILFPTIQPTVTNPSVEIKCNVPTLRKVGSSFPQTGDFTCTANRGNVTYVNKEGNNYYAGATKSGSDSLTVNNGIDFGDVINSDTRYTVTYSTIFSDGPELLDNKGQSSTVTSYREGMVSKNMFVDFVYPIYVNSNEDITEMKELDLKNYHTSGKVVYEVEIPEEIAGYVFTVHVPSTLNYEIKEWNDVASKYDETLVGMNQNGTVEHDGINYNVYVKADTSLDGSSKYEITIIK